MSRKNIYFDLDKIYEAIVEKLNKSKIQYSTINIYNVSLELAYNKNIIKTKYYYMINNNKFYDCYNSVVSYKVDLVKSIEKNNVKI
ncbi:MAG: hypothetical protein ACRCUM_02055 [Mycoplasmoidaceae bacterium]